MITSLSLCSCVSDSKYDELEERVSRLERIHGITNAESNNNQDYLDKNDNIDNSCNSEYLEAKGIGIFYDFDDKQQSWSGESYFLTLRGEKCSFEYYNIDTSEVVKCDFSKDVYYNVLNVISSETLERYTNNVDANGKVVYGIVHRMLGLYLEGSGYIYFREPSNMDEIIAEF